MGKFVDTDFMLQQFLRNYHLTSFGVIFFSFLCLKLHNFPLLLCHRLEHNHSSLSSYPWPSLSRNTLVFCLPFLLNSFILRYTVKFILLKYMISVYLQSHSVVFERFPLPKKSCAHYQSCPIFPSFPLSPSPCQPLIFGVIWKKNAIIWKNY